MVILQRVHPTLPVVVAANRDEFYARPATPPRVLSERPRVVGGQDAERGGTWMGVTETGLFVGLTNQRTEGPPDKTLRSRGDVVVEALRQGSPEGVAALLATLDPGAYNPFNLVFGDARGLSAAYCRPEAPRIDLEPVPDGLHVLPNGRLDADYPKVERALRLAAPHVAAPWPALAARLADVLADRQLPPPEAIPEPPPDSQLDRHMLRALQAICIATPVYGTRSATIAALAPGRVAHYWFADGAPCEAPFTDYTALVDSPGRP